MGKLGCTIDGSLDDSKFSEPMPWIGIYVAAASAACATAMAVDAFRGFRNRKFWFPCKYFSLNATTLTLVGVAIKLSVDLNTSMPRRQDQLAKLSSAVFICTVMGNSLPSIGTMENKEILTNVIALGILVITAIVNICIQLGTGVIYVFWKEHAFVMLLMLLLLATLCSSALTVPTTKCYFNLIYSKKHRLPVKESSQRTDMPVTEKLKGDLMKYWVMAHTCSPQFVLGRLATSTASGAFCLLGALTLAEAIMRSHLMPWSFKFCSGESEYKWSTTLVLVTQTIAVGAGTIAPTFRWFAPINFGCPKKAIKAGKHQFKVESYWITRLLQWKECPFSTIKFGRHGRKLVHNTKTQLLDFCIWTQTGIVWVSKLIQLISIFFMSRFFICRHWCKEQKRLLKYNSSVSRNECVKELEIRAKPDLDHFVLHLEGEEELVDLMTENNCDATSHWFQMGKKKQPKYLIKLLEKSTSTAFKGVSEFDSHEVPCLESEEPPNCWALPVVTLTGIALALPNINKNSIKELSRSVHEGLTYIRDVENNLDDKLDFINIRNAAEIVWLGVDVYRRWLDVDLRKMALQEESPKQVLEKLADIAKNRFREFKERDMNACLRESPSMWPTEVLAANSMYRICQTLLLENASRDDESSDKLFKRLSNMISDIMGACFTNLPRVIHMQCHRSSIEEREESVRYAVLLLGKSEKILNIIGRKSFPSSDPAQLAQIDLWRVMNKAKDSEHFTSSLEDSDTGCISSPDLHLTID